MLVVAVASATMHDQRMIEQGIESPPTNPTVRRVRAMVLTGLAVVAVSVVSVALWNPWRYVYLMPLGRLRVVLTVLFAVPVLLGCAAWLVLRRRLAWAVAVVAAVLALAVACVGLMGAARAGTESNDSRVVAVSPGGSFEVVVLSDFQFMGGFDILRIHSRAGLLSREAAQDLGWFCVSFDGVGPEDTFDTARFLSEHEVEVRTEAGEAWRTTFDPQTLLAASTLTHWCQ
jgi:hypothetical protein